MDNYIEHHGILGQKWGVRRYQNQDGSYTAAGKSRRNSDDTFTENSKKKQKISNKELKKEKNDLFKKYMTEDPRYSKMEEYEKKADALAEKYDFDGDDGGGGTTAADKKAGQKYMEYWEKYEQLEDEISSSAKQKATKDLIDKYGQKRMDQLRRSDNAKAAVAVTAGMAYVAAFVFNPIVTMGVTAGGLSAATAYGVKKGDAELRESQKDK